MTNNLINKYEDHKKYEWRFSQTSQVTQEGAVLWLQTSFCFIMDVKPVMVLWEVATSEATKAGQFQNMQAVHRSGLNANGTMMV